MFGRRTDLERLERLLMPTGALVSIVGAPGIGKTRLATEVLSKSPCADRFVLWLADVTTDRELMEALARATHAEIDARGGDALAQVGLALGEMGELLVLFDNVEQAIEPVSRALEVLRQAAPLARFLLTSRQRLHATNEWVLELAPLGVPQADEDPSESDAVRMLVDRVERARGAAVDPTEIAHLADIARRLDGIPLAIELFSPRIATLGAEAVASSLRLEPAIHTEGPRSIGQRQRTLHDAIHTSWELLDRREREALSRLAVFAGGFTLDAALAVLSHAAEGSALDLLHGLRERSLIVTMQQHPPRFSVFESVREFAREMAPEPRDEAERLRARHFAEEVERAAASPDGATKRALMMEQENLRAIVAWGRAFDDPEARATAARILLGLQVLVDRVPLEPYLSDLESFGAAATASLEPALRVGLALATARCKRRLGRRDEALQDQDLALAIATEHGLEAWQGRVLSERGMVHFVRGDLEAALADWDASTALFERHREAARVAVDQLRASMALREKGDLLLAVERAERAYVAARRLRHPDLGALALGELAQLRLELGDEGRATALLDEAEHTEERSMLADAAIVARRGFVDLSRGKLDAAKQRLQRGLFLLSRIGYRRFEGGVLGYLGVIELLAGHADRARTLLEQACDLLRDYATARGLFSAWAARLELDASNEVRAQLLAADVPPLDPSSPLSVASHVLCSLDSTTRARLSGAPLAGARAPAAKASLDVRLALRHFELHGAAASEAPAPDLLIVTDGSTFELGGQRWSIQKHVAMRRILIRLVEHHLAGSTEPLAVETLARAGWPGERILEAAAKNRVKVAIAGLRKHGLRDLLVHDGAGYALAPRATVEVRAALPPSGEA